jgi:hypothetical protein
MRRTLILMVSGLLFVQFVPDDAAAQRLDGRPGFARPAFAGAGFVRPGWAGSAWRPGWAASRPDWGWRAASASFGRPGWARPAWRPGWNSRPGWGLRPGWGWGAAGLGFAAGALAAAPVYASFGNDCPIVRRQVWDGFRYRIAWVNACNYY